MSNPNSNFQGVNDKTYLRGYQHATKLYLDSRIYSKIPKVGFLYYIQLNVNKDLVDETWANYRTMVGLLAKKADLPKFKIKTETVNQYNRKTVVQTQLTYEPINIEFHDDVSNITHDLWVNYFKHHYADSNYNDPGVSSISKNNIPEAFRDTKYIQHCYEYGRYARKNNEPFFSSIEIFVLHSGEFTKFTIVNPKISEWSHDALSQSEGAKVLQNKMSLAYETVFYDQGVFSENETTSELILSYYDNSGSPLQNGSKRKFENQSGNKKASKFDIPKPISKNGNRSRAPNPLSTFDVKRPPVVNNMNTRKANPLQDAGKIIAKNYMNKHGIGPRLSPLEYNIAQGALGQLKDGPGKYASPPPTTQDQPGIFTLPGGVGINVFKAFNESVDGKIRANPASIILPPKR